MFFFASGVQAASVTLSAGDSGWYGSISGHDTSNSNYSVGFCINFCSPAETMRNFFVFDLSGVNDTITGATLHVFNPSNPFNGYASLDATETYELFSYESSVVALVGGTGSYSDLGDGTSYGTVSVSAADNGSFVDVTLNASALSDLNSATGLFALGGVISTLSGESRMEGVFGFSSHREVRELILATVPIPAAVWLFGSALGLLGWMRHKVT